MKILVPVAGIAGVMAIGAGVLIDRDFAVAAVQYTMAPTYGMVAISIIPLIYGARKSIIAPGLFGIAISSIMLALYGAIAISLGRPNWWLEGWPSWIYLFGQGVLVASLGHHFIALGQVQGMRGIYLTAYGIFTAIGISLAWFFVEFSPYR